MALVETRESTAGQLRAATEKSSATQMRRRNWKIVRLLVLVDTLATLFAIIAANALTEPGSKVANPGWVGFTLPLVLITFSFYRLYERDRRQISVSTLDELRDVFNALALVCFIELAFGLGAGATGAIPNRSATVVAFFALALALIPGLRAALRLLVFPRTTFPQATLVVGAGKVGQEIVRKILKHPHYNVNIVGFLDDDPSALHADLADIPVLGGERDLVQMIERYRISRVVLAFSRSSHEDVLNVVRHAGLRDVQVSIVPRYFELIAANVGIADVEGIAVLELPEAGLSRFARFTKRMFDLAITLPLLVLLSPLLIVLAVAIKIDSRGPVFFRQARIGSGDRTFRIFKFRTMVSDAESLRDELLDSNESTGPLFKIRDDPRVTRVGRFLRRYTLDELPQLFNVIRGEMSLVGPRPFVTYEDEKIDGWARRRLDLTPGITGVWQVLGRNEIGYEEMVKLDYLYVTNWSLWWDIKLLLRTIPIVFARSGY